MGALTGAVALITGASGGIGSCIARRLAREGVNLALLGRNMEKLQQTAGSLAHTGVQTLLLPGDLLDDAYLARCVSQVRERFGRLDILINNAGMALSRRFDETTMAEFDRIMALNCRAPYLLCQAALPDLRASGRGTIINIASVNAHKGYPLQSAYSASKHALAGFTKSLASEVYREGVRVHLISPGGVFTDMVRIARPDLTGEDMILPEDIAEIAAFLLLHRTNAVIDEIAVHRAGKEPFL
ncbi:MAG: SDR family NAD(P)-dependent oxidoreductase [Oscillospiraceae bacterium]